MPILFQIDEIEPPVQVELKKKRGRPKKSGGATDTQRGQAARYRTHVREAVDIPKYECLFRNLSYIVHSADEKQKDDNPFATGADTDEYDAEAQMILDQAEANLKRLRELKALGVKPTKEGMCREDWDRAKSALKPFKIARQKDLFAAHEREVKEAEDKKVAVAVAAAEPDEKVAAVPRKKGPSAAAVEANRLKQLAENAARREAKKAAKEAEKALKVGKGAPIELWGGKLSTKYINEFISNSYNAKGKLPAKIGDFQLDKSLSGQRAQVYHNPATGEAVVVHRGSQGIHDWGNNLKYFLGFDLKKTDRGKFAAKVQKEAEAKYGAKNISTLGHSIGGKIASDVGADSKEIITLNRAVAGRDLFKNPIKENEYSIRTQLDPVSFLLPKDSKTLTIPSTSLNPLTEHSTDVAKRLDPAVEVGRGFSRAALAKLNKKQIKEIIKALPKIKDGFKLVGKGKPQLLDYCCERCKVGVGCEG
jgi:hypothetical protein